MKVREKKLVFNAAQCVKCDEVVVSTHRHDFRTCKCGAIAVDGGNDYARRCGDIHNAKDLCEYEDVIREESDWEREWREKGYSTHGIEYVEE